jgi:hypothetical protein
MHYVKRKPPPPTESPSRKRQVSYYLPLTKGILACTGDSTDQMAPCLKAFAHHPTGPSSIATALSDIGPSYHVRPSPSVFALMRCALVNHFAAQYIYLMISW